MAEQVVSFNDTVEYLFSELDIFTKAIKQVHGKSHPEAIEIRELFEIMNKKVGVADTNKPNLVKEIAQLRNITSNYTVPKHVCETYAATYDLLAKVDKAYHAS